MGTPPVKTIIFGIEPRGRGALKGHEAVVEEAVVEEAVVEEAVAEEAVAEEALE